MHSLGLFGSSKLTAKAVVIALVAGLLGMGLTVAIQEPANAAACGSGSSSATYSGGDGLSTSTAFRIATSADLIRLAASKAVNTVDLTRHFIQTADINLGSCAWTPIGGPENADLKFTGTYDGQGFSISGLDLRPAAANGGFGLFGRVNGATIKDLVVRGVIVALQGDHGGIVGRSAGTTNILRVRSEVNITHSGYINAGGVVGSMDSGTLTVSQSSYSGTMTMNVASGSAAGIIGSPVHSGGDTFAISDSYSRVVFSGTNPALTAARAGLIGTQTPTAVRSYSVAAGALSGISSTGLTSSSEGSFWDNEVGPTIARATGAAVPGTTAKTTTQMKSLATYTTTVPSPSKELPTAWAIVQGWEAYNFVTPSNRWGICSGVNDGYPFLLWEYATDPCPATPPPSDSGSGSSSGSVYVAPVVVPEAVIPLTIRQTTTRPATDDKPARLLGRSLDKDVLFIADSARLSPEAKKSLRQAARLAMASDSKVAVTGFAAMTGRGSAYEKSVAQKRALAVSRYLRAQGFDDWIYYQGLSGRQGLAFDGDPRRVEIRLLN